MTQPEQPRPTGGQVAAVLATAAGTYALIAVEARIREEVEDALIDMFLLLAALLTVALATPAGIAVGMQLFANAYLYEGMRQALAAARTKVTSSIRAGDAAAAYVAHTKAVSDLAKYGYVPSGSVAHPGEALDRILDDVNTMFLDTQAQIQNDLAAAYDGIQGPAAGPARTVALNAALQRIQDRITQRATATAATAVHQAAADTQQSIYNDFQTDSGYRNLMKRWHTTAADPCGMCAALDGTMVGINAEFDHDASDTQQDWRRVWRNLQGPPRHPNCRCTIELVVT